MGRRCSVAASATLAAVVMLAAGCSASGRSLATGRPAGRVVAGAPPTTFPGVRTPRPSIESTLPVLDEPLAGVPRALGSWTLVGRTAVPGPYSDQGLATVSRIPGPVKIVYAGILTIPKVLQDEGWNHVGDPDGWHGWLVMPFQGGPDVRAKLFQVTAPDGVVTRALHSLEPGEEPNNSFAAVTPDGLWTVSGEWGVERRLLVFPTPAINSSSPGGRPLPLVATVALRTPVSDLQGCAFTSPIDLVCTDAEDLLGLKLDHPIQPNHALAAAVHTIGSIPEVGGCQGSYEPEGVDVDRTLGQLRIEVSQPGICKLLTQVYEYRDGGAD